MLELEVSQNNFGAALVNIISAVPEEGSAEQPVVKGSVLAATKCIPCKDGRTM